MVEKKDIGTIHTSIADIDTVATVQKISSGTIDKVTQIDTISQISSTIDVNIAHGDVYDSTNKAIKVVEIAPSGTVKTENVDIVAQSYSPLIVRTDSSSTIAEVTNIGSTVDVAITGQPISVTATDLDIRDLSSATDSIAAVQSGSWNVGLANTSGTININEIADDSTRQLGLVYQGTSPWVITATDLDIRDLSSATDSVSAIQGTTPWSVKFSDNTSTVQIGNFPSEYPLPASQVTDLKSVTVTNFPSVQDVNLVNSSGTVQIGNWPTTQNVDIVAQSYSPLNVLTDNTSTVNAVLQTDNIGLATETTLSSLDTKFDVNLSTRMPATGGTIAEVTTIGSTVDVAITGQPISVITDNSSSITVGFPYAETTFIDGQTNSILRLRVDPSTGISYFAGLPSYIFTYEGGGGDTTPSWARVKGNCALNGGTIGTDVGGILATVVTGWDDTNNLMRRLKVDADHNLKVLTAPASTVNAVLQTDNIGLMKSTGGTIAEVTNIGSTVDVNIAATDIVVPTDQQANYYNAHMIVSSSTNVDAGSTVTSTDISCADYVTKTVSVYSSASSTLIIEVSPSGTGTYYTYYTESTVPADTLFTRSFTEAFDYMRVKYVSDSASTLSLFSVGLQTG